jgi:zinc/manganese transport system substrate-binding protein
MNRQISRAATARVARALALGAVCVALTLGRAARIARAQPRQAGTIGVVAAENFWGDIASQLGGGHVSVTSIITDPSADPHEYESSVADATAIANAQLVILNGVGYDSFMQKLLSASPNSNRTVITVGPLVGKQEGDNPHLWYNLNFVAQAADTFTATLQTLDPADVSDYAAANAQFKASLQPILNKEATIAASYAGTHVAETERVAGYAIDAMGLIVDEGDFQHSIEEGNDPSPQSVQQLSDAITNRDVKVLFYNTQTVTPITDNIKALAQQSGVPIVGVSETEPPGDTYQQWQMSQLTALQQALGG